MNKDGGMGRLVLLTQGRDHSRCGLCQEQPREAVLPDWIRQEAQAPGQLDLLPEGECSNGPLKGDWDGPVTQVEFAEWYLAGLR